MGAGSRNPRRPERAVTVDELLVRCTFPPAGTAVTCAFSGGADSSALVALAAAAGLAVTAVHVDHGIRPTSGAQAAQAADIAATLGVAFRAVAVRIEPGPNLEARARAARLAALPPGHLTGHTADDQAETVLVNLLRGAGIAGLAGMAPGPTHPLLALRRHETTALCAALGLDVVTDESNDDRRFVRNRIRHEVLPLLDDVARRDVAALLARTAAVLHDDAALLDHHGTAVDPTDARALAAVEPAVARRALRSWLTRSGYPPDRASVARAYAVATGRARACQVTGGIRVERSRGHLRIVAGSPVASPSGEG